MVIVTLVEPLIFCLEISLADLLVVLKVVFLALFGTIKDLLTEARYQLKIALLISQLLLLLENVNSTIVAVGDMSQLESLLLGNCLVKVGVCRLFEIVWLFDQKEFVEETRSTLVHEIL